MFELQHGALLCASLGCGSAAPAQVHDAGASDAARAQRDARDAQPSTTRDDDAAASGASTQMALIERGGYLVNAVAVCGNCHTPRKPDGSFDESKALSGVECLADVDLTDPTRGCVHSRNLTNHETGLKNRSDDEIKDMIRKGERPDDKAMHPLMPYWAFANMNDADLNAIVAYLRTVPGVDHMTPPDQPPFLAPDAPIDPLPLDAIPAPRPDYPDLKAAQRGRYLATRVGTCIACHTPRDDRYRPVLDGLPLGNSAPDLVASRPHDAYAGNLTPDATGLGAASVDDIARAIRAGTHVAMSATALCPPMRAGGVSVFAGIRDADAQDIAQYLRSLAPRAGAMRACRTIAHRNAEDGGGPRPDCTATSRPRRSRPISSPTSRATSSGATARTSGAGCACHPERRSTPRTWTTGNFRLGPCCSKSFR